MTAGQQEELALNLSPQAMRELLDAVSERVLGFHQELADGAHPASYVNDSLQTEAYEAGRKICAELREDEVPRQGAEVGELLDELFGPATANGTMHPHPGFMAHVPSGGLFQGAVGDFIARSINRFAGVWIAAPGFQQIERNVIRWYGRMLGYGEGSFGYLTTGGSIANLMGLLCARRAAEDLPGEPVVYVSSEGHYSVAKAAGIAGIPGSRIRSVAAREDCAMDLGALRAAIAADRAAGLVPAAVVGTAGTTNSGAVDDLAAIAGICREEGIWFHADACFGGFFRITERGRAALRGIEEADSIAVDAHKSLFLPHGSSALLVKDQESLRRTFEIPGASYLPGLVEEDEIGDFCTYGPELSREIRGLTAWLPLKMHGVDAFEACMDEKLDLIEYLARELPRIDGLEVVADHPLHLPVLNFKFTAEGLGQGELDRLNAKLCELVCSHGNVYLTTTELPRHGMVVRVCILHPRTGRAVVDQLLKDIAWAAGRLRAPEEI
ncbi:pyridoxal phosphate-dependent decarboxylase family protein [Streptomyces sp. NPDC006487]|uniref:pyridoxal phosphate-dependent decarboxylase family protein n=1 Tax=Streptomyces sp. NPDC006487 TaxID=3364748 RepID=UPI00368771BA